MQSDDVDAVMQIELCRDKQDMPWPKDLFIKCLLAGYYGIVLENKNKIIGYSIVKITDHVANILNICVMNTERRKGFGTTLIKYLVSYIKNSKCDSIILKVRQSKKDLQTFYEKQGFQKKDLLNDYYTFDTQNENAIVYNLQLAN